ncbi:MAG: hypothetical protein GC186_09865 [Rhodobacteraceae bacterium]|nr:hypothetical protein [Paracoccaceae bacterium]
MLHFFSTALLGLIAAIVGAYLQQRSWRHRSFEELRQREVSDGLNLIAELAERIDQRLVSQRSFSALLDEGAVKEEDYKRYRESILSWMGNFSSLKSRLKHYFGADAVRTFEGIVHRRMQVASDIMLRTYKLGFENLSRQHKAEQLAISVYHSRAQKVAFDFLDNLNGALDSGKIGKSASINDLYSYNLDMISNSYLLQRFFGLKA